MRNGRYADIVPSNFYSNSNFDNYYCDYGGVVADTGRCVLRSGYDANAFSGVAYVNASSASSDSSAHVGARLAFRGKCEITE